jgi:hypothetical protein
MKVVLGSRGVGGEAGSIAAESSAPARGPAAYEKSGRARPRNAEPKAAEPERYEARIRRDFVLDAPHKQKYERKA